MKLALFIGLGGITWDGVVGMTRHAEATGWDAACLTDHFMPNTPEAVGDNLECVSALAALAALVPRIRLGSIVLGNTYRHPAVLAKALTNIDIISGGRLIAGIGGAWQQNEHEKYGIPFYTVGERLKRLDEACEVLKALWTQDRATFKGRYYQLTDAPASPKPVQKPYPELLIGGGGEKVTLKIAAKHADHWNTWGGPRILAAKNAILDAHCAAVGRDPKTILRSAVMPLVFGDKAEVGKVRQAAVKRMGFDEAKAQDTILGGSPAEIIDTLGTLREAGVGLLFLPSMFFPKDPRPLLDRFMTEVAPAVR
ncbi:MAG: TIGR03560 family F420-dependent LLM class oxidoreductase [Candidatus Rokubacteria bacterium]|nr:TIGR03560 family F420-dependent LLM class oxidoreductase [Candidatus Rokubacteria bacterium]